MAKTSRRKSAQTSVDDISDDEISAFSKQQDQILLEDSSLYQQPNKRSRNWQEDEDLSDEEVLAMDQSESEDGYVDNEEDEEAEDYDLDKAYQNSDGGSDDYEVGDWGTKKSDYYGADEADDEEAARLEEEEAAKIQKEQLNSMKASDFFEEDDLAEWKESAKNAESASLNLDQAKQDALVQQDLSSMPTSERVDLLNSMYPEFLPLLEEYKDLKEAEKSLADSLSEDPLNSLDGLKMAACRSYLGTINAYLALFIENIGKPVTSLKQHPVMTGLVKAGEAWRVAQSLKPSGKGAEQDESSEIETDSSDEQVELDTRIDENSDEDDDIDSDEGEFSESEDDEVDEDEFEIKETKRSKNRNKLKQKLLDNDMVEGEIDTSDLKDKSLRKKSLRFYTSKIDQQSNKNREKYGGDMDLPYRERHFDRQQRLTEAARQRGLKGDSVDEADNFDDNDVDAEEDDFYNSAKSKSKARKESKKLAHEAAVRAAREGKLQELQDEVGEDGKRAISYQIAKNKGLSNKRRKKEDRNSRVKKRKRFDTAEKKIASMRQVYKAPTSSYAGEQTGIRKNVTKSRKF